MHCFIFFLFSVLFFTTHAQNLATPASISTPNAKNIFTKQDAAHTENDAKLNEAVKNCIDKKELASCLVATPRLNFDKQYALAFKTGEILCELEAVHCYGAYYIALNFNKKKAEDFLAKILSECEKNADFCDAVAGLHEDQKNYELALLAAKKYYTKHKKGSYIVLAHKYGNKQDAYDASLADCKTNSDQCVYYLRYFYEHPQKDEILKNAVKNCTEAKNLTLEANNCAILGTYYFKIQEFDLAYKYWSKDCETNNLSCLLILGSKRYNDDANKSALKKFCTVKASAAGSYNLQLVECEKIDADTVRTPPAVEKFASETLKSFMSEQKLAN